MLSQLFRLRFIRPAALVASAVMATALLSAPAVAEITARPGWEIHASQKDFATLLADLKAAIKDQGLGVVTEAGPTGAAAARGITIPGNRVVGVFANDYSVEILSLSTAAMIEAPIRFYVTENADGTATLSYKTPTYVFTPYLPEAGEKLAAVAARLDTTFAAIATSALRP